MAEIIDWEQFDAVVGDGSDGMAELFQEFVEDVEGKLATMTVSSANLDGAAIAWDAHQMKGSAGSFGMKAFADDIGALEITAKNGDFNIVSDSIPRLEELFRRSITEIKSQRSSIIP